ncbi:MAG: hypothetical protein J7L96_01795 [Bacteroidales bacterium]|nr:hypothetical protein [Bacteroidales bacterium]
MKNKKKHATKAKEKKLKNDTIKELKERIKHQKDAWNKILNSIQTTEKGKH